MSQISSVLGLISLLKDSDSTIQTYALKSLLVVVDTAWPSIAEHIELVSQFNVPEAHILLAKLYFHLGKLDKALDSALKSESFLESWIKSDFTETLTTHAIDRYRQLQDASDSLKEEIPSELTNLIEILLEDALKSQESPRATWHNLGVAIDLRRFDYVEKLIIKSVESGTELADLIEYCTDNAKRFVQKASSRRLLLEALISVIIKAKLEDLTEEIDHIKLCELNTLLDDPQAIAVILSELVTVAETYDGPLSSKPHLKALQICLDLNENAPRHFIDAVLERVPRLPDVLSRVLSGNETRGLQIRFLHRFNKSDLSLLNHLQPKIRSNDSFLKSVLVMAHGFMSLGTTSDEFLLENKNWIMNVSDWAKFTCAASLGLVHRGHTENWMTVLENYLPTPAHPSPYSEGGALFAAGLINTGNPSLLPYLLESLANAGPHQPIKHGSSLALGLAGLGSRDESAFEALRMTLYSEESVPGEAAGVAMGLVMLGGQGAATHIEEMLSYAKSTDFEKIIRGIGMGISLMMYGAEERADTMIQQLSIEKDPLLRYSGALTLGMAYAGTSNESAVRRALDAAVSDADENVKRAAVIAYALITFKEKIHCLPTLSLLSKSYSMSVRYGAGISCGLVFSGTADPKVVDLLLELWGDSEPIVRQAAAVGLGMVLMGTNEARAPRYSSIKEKLIAAVASKHDHRMAKMGSILGLGLLDAGGKNCAFRLTTSNGSNDHQALVGALVFSQFWFWHPFAYFSALAIKPTYFVGVDGEMRIPQFPLSFVSCSGRQYSKKVASEFDYPESWTDPKKKEGEDDSVSEMVELSYTRRGEKRKKETSKILHRIQSSGLSDLGKPMGNDSPAIRPKPIVEVEVSEVSNEGGDSGETVLLNLTNPCRVPIGLESMIKVESERYLPLRKIQKISGVIVFQDNEPAEEVIYVDIGKIEEDVEIKPPASFEYRE